MSGSLVWQSKKLKSNKVFINRFEMFELTATLRNSQDVFVSILKICKYFAFICVCTLCMYLCRLELGLVRVTSLEQLSLAEFTGE